MLGSCTRISHSFYTSGSLYMGLTMLAVCLLCVCVLSVPLWALHVPLLVLRPCTVLLCALGFKTAALHSVLLVCNASWATLQLVAIHFWSVYVCGYVKCTCICVPVVMQIQANACVLLGGQMNCSHGDVLYSVVVLMRWQPNMSSLTASFTSGHPV